MNGIGTDFGLFEKRLWFVFEREEAEKHERQKMNKGLMFVFLDDGQNVEREEKTNIEGRNREECSGIMVFGSAVMSRFVTMMK